MGQFIDKAFTIPLISQCDVCPNSLRMVTITQTDRHLTFWTRVVKFLSSWPWPWPTWSLTWLINLVTNLANKALANLVTNLTKHNLVNNNIRIGLVLGYYFFDLNLRVEEQKLTPWSNWAWPWSRQSCFTNFYKTFLHYSASFSKKNYCKSSLYMFLFIVYMQHVKCRISCQYEEGGSLHLHSQFILDKLFIYFQLQHYRWQSLSQGRIGRRRKWCGRVIYVKSCKWNN